MQSLKDYQPVVEQRIAQLCARLDEFSESGQVLDLHEWLGYFVWDGKSIKQLSETHLKARLNQ